MSPKPGPTFEIDVAAADIADKKSSPVNDKSIDKNINRTELDFKLYKKNEKLNSY